ncbi:hypothetical protein CIPAW_10G040900 [Carya illinoinensis]|uniref:Uncharacterized protein n=1 Tax=Carya illinoinensis TaxID=32201 RepID=A0A8T1P245_CARIL|nr:hypothetical protein CIPAW_10G040900 [Carya illinoinensis]
MIQQILTLHITHRHSHPHQLQILACIFQRVQKLSRRQGTLQHPIITGSILLNRTSTAVIEATNMNLLDFRGITRVQRHSEKNDIDTELSTDSMCVISALAFWRISVASVMLPINRFSRTRYGTTKQTHRIPPKPLKPLPTKSTRIFRTQRLLCYLTDHVAILTELETELHSEKSSV